LGSFGNDFSVLTVFWLETVSPDCREQAVKNPLIERIPKAKEAWMVFERALK
jgi:hypothetical protein